MFSILNVYIIHNNIISSKRSHNYQYIYNTLICLRKPQMKKYVR